MPVTWSTTSESQLNQGIKILVWAKSGLGKTTLCATAPRPIIVSAESGLLSLNKKNLERVYGPADPLVTYAPIPVMQIKTVQDLTDCYNWFTSAAEAKMFDTICIDSISEIGETVLNNAKRVVKDPRQAYGELIEKMETVIRAFRDLPQKHVYMAAKAQATKDELSGILLNGPSMPGSKLGEKLPYFFDEVFELAVNKTTDGTPYRYLRTQPDLQNIAKDRSGTLAAIEEPHLTKVFNKILSGV